MLKIGIVAQDTPEDKFGTNKTYLEFIENFGHPILILPIEFDNFHDIYNIDALLLPGGSDVNPTRYNQIPSVWTYNANPYQEHFDTQILPQLIGKLPIFGICRGLQTINVTCGGTLFQNLFWHKRSTYENHLCHKVHIHNHKNKENTFEVNSFHHQAIDTLANNFIPEVYSDDGFIEAISDFDNRIFAVQWHPERMRDDEYSIDMFNKILS